MANPVTNQNRYHQVLLFITDAVQAQSGCLLLKDLAKETYFVKACLAGRHFSFPQEECVKFIQWLKKNRRAISRQQILAESQFFPIKIHGLNFFLHFQAEVGVPLWNGEDLMGLLALSPRRNGVPYTTACLDLLDWLADELALFFQNTLLTETLRRQQVELETIADLKSKIIANLSHELRTPLTSIIGFAELLAEEVDGSLSGAQQRHVEQILAGGNRLLKTLSAFVDMAKLAAHQYPLHITQFHLVPLLESIVSEVSSPSDLLVELKIEEETPWVYGDLQVVRQIFRHLLDNAVKYTPKGTIAVTAMRKGEMVEVCIADTGIGIPSEKLPKIFNGFFQVSGGLAREYQGSGIGLALAKKMVEAHGGRLWVKSQVGEGSQFYFTLPLKPIGIKHRELAA